MYMYIWVYRWHNVLMHTCVITIQIVRCSVLQCVVVRCSVLQCVLQCELQCACISLHNLVRAHRYCMDTYVWWRSAQWAVRVFKVESERDCLYNTIVRRLIRAHCYTLQHTATHCHTLPHTATHTASHTATPYGLWFGNSTAFDSGLQAMGWLRSVGSIKIQVSFAECRLFL